MERKKGRAPRPAVLTALLLAALLSLSGIARGEDFAQSVEEQAAHLFSCAFQGVKHSFTVDLPEDPEGSPLILVLPGYGSTAEAFRSRTGLEKEANPRGYTVVYVTGARDGEDRTAAVGWNYEKADGGRDDAGFLCALADYVCARWGTDEARVYAVGFSNGAFMAHRLAVEGTGFAAVVSVAGSMADSVWERRPERCRVSVLQITGEKDSVIPKHSDGSAKTAAGPAIEDVMEYYAAANRLEESETETVGKASRLTKYRAGASDREVWHLVVKDGRHSWSAGSVTGIDTNALILRFLDLQ